MTAQIYDMIREIGYEESYLNIKHQIGVYTALVMVPILYITSGEYDRDRSRGKI